MKALRKVFQKILSFTLFPFLKIYLTKSRTYKYDGILLTIPPGVFHPGFFFSTNFLLSFILHLSLKGKTFLELGAGSALISFCVSKRGALVTASDISTTVIQNIEVNQKINHQLFEIIQSDLFANFSKRIFDIVVINPPYYKREPQSEEDYAWYCGENSEYFIRLFSELKDFITTESIVLMVLSEDCAVDEIKQIAYRNNFVLKNVKRKRIWLEENFIFEIKSTTNE